MRRTIPCGAIFYFNKSDILYSPADFDKRKMAALMAPTAKIPFD